MAGRVGGYPNYFKSLNIKFAIAGKICNIIPDFRKEILLKNNVFLLVGQRGSGKSYYGKRLVENHPELTVVSRDEILVRRFGSVHTDPYSGAGYYAQEILYRLLRRKLGTQTNVKLLLDCWTRDSRERKNLLRKLRSYGANRVVALYFVTPLKTVETWFWQKPGIAKIRDMKNHQGERLSFFSDDAPRHDHELFHKLASKIDSDGFDKVMRIDPTKKLVVLV